jgi:hypothetical protein
VRAEEFWLRESSFLRPSPSAPPLTPLILSSSPLLTTTVVALVSCTLHSQKSEE